MGYTHYFQLHEKPTDEQWDLFTNDVDALLLANDVPLDNRSTWGKININGIDENSHENLIIQSDNLRWDFCKTARKPYDKIVTAILIAARYDFGNNFSLSSDGNWEEWEEGCNLVKHTLGYYAEESEVFGNKNHNFPYGAGAINYPNVSA